MLVQTRRSWACSAWGHPSRRRQEPPTQQDRLFQGLAASPLRTAATLSEASQAFMARSFTASATRQTVGLWGPQKGARKRGAFEAADCAPHPVHSELPPLDTTSLNPSPRMSSSGVSAIAQEMLDNAPAGAAAQPLRPAEETLDPGGGSIDASNSVVREHQVRPTQPIQQPFKVPAIDSKPKAHNTGQALDSAAQIHFPKPEEAAPRSRLQRIRDSYDNAADYLSDLLKAVEEEIGLRCAGFSVHIIMFAALPRQSVNQAYKQCTDCAGAKKQLHFQRTLFLAPCAPAHSLPKACSVTVSCLGENKRYYTIINSLFSPSSPCRIPQF